MLKRFWSRRLQSSMVVGAALIMAANPANAQIIVPEHFDLSVPASVPVEPRERTYRLTPLRDWPAKERSGFTLEGKGVRASLGINRVNTSFLLRKESATRFDRPLFKMRRALSLLVIVELDPR